MIKVEFSPGVSQLAEPGVRLVELLEKHDPQLLPVAALVNGSLQELDYPLYSDSSVQWLDYDSSIGWRVYRRTLVFLLDLAVRQLFPGRQLWVSHSLSEGFFCYLIGPEGRCHSLPAEVSALHERMRDFVRDDLPISRSDLTPADAAAFFLSRGEADKAQLLSKRDDKESMHLYTAAGHSDYFFGKMAVSARFVPQFDLVPYEDGFVLHLPARQYLGVTPSDTLSTRQLQTTLDEYEEWSQLMGVKTVTDLNRVVEAGEKSFTELVLVAETLQERNLHHVSDLIFADFPQVRLVLLAGPSSSGKTTTTHRLAIQFRTIGVRPVVISLDDYFVDREKTPLTPEGTPDYEGLAALDIELFQQNMLDLLAGKEAVLPRYDFQTGKSIRNDRRLRLADDQLLLVEGLHALNESISAAIPRENKRKVFISALTQLNIDHGNPVSSSDNRLLRRILRDVRCRSTSPEQTIDRWNEVRRGEHKNIFPYQEEADFFLNSALIYELPVLRPQIEDALAAIPADRPCYMEARRLLRLIRYFMPAPMDAIPRTSILREFLGDGLFD